MTPAHEGPWPCISVCVDDFGLHEGINQAVFALARQGRVQAVSVMAGGPAWARDAPVLRGFDRQHVEAGLHLDLTEHPLHPGTRLPLRRLIARAWLRRLDAEALRAEIRAQFDAFEAAMQRAPDYVDGHQHIHQFPVVRALLLEEIARRYPTGGPWLRATQPGERMNPKSRMIAALGGGALSTLARRQGLRQNAHLLGVYGFSGGARRYRARLIHWLGLARHGDLLMCHAGLPSQAFDALAQARQDEFAVLDSPEFPALLRSARVQLAPMQRILDTPQPA